VKIRQKGEWSSISLFKYGGSNPTDDGRQKRANSNFFPNQNTSYSILAENLLPSSLAERSASIDVGAWAF